MVFLIECLVACILFTLMIQLATWKQQVAFTNDYPPVVTDKLRDKGLIAQKPPARKKDYIRKAVAMIVYAFLFALVLLLIFAFWVCIPLLVIGLFAGYRYAFTGAELGRESVNNAMDKAAEAVERVKEEVTREH